MRKTILTIATVTLIVLVSLALVASPSFALDAMTSTGTPVGSGAGNSSQLTNRLNRLRARADQEITRRINSLNNLINRIGNMKRLTSDQKSTLVSQIQTAISGLNALKTKIDADTDWNTAKTDTQSIITSYRIYALFIPKINILANSDRILDVSDQMSSYSGKLQTRIQQAQSKGKDVSSLLPLLTDMQSKIADAKVQAQNAQNAVLPLTPDGYPANKTTLMSARDMLQTARRDLQFAWQDGRKIRQGLVSLNKPAGGTPPLVATPSGGQ